MNINFKPETLVRKKKCNNSIAKNLSQCFRKTEMIEVCFNLIYFCNIF